MLQFQNLVIEFGKIFVLGTRSGVNAAEAEINKCGERKSSQLVVVPTDQGTESTTP